MAKFDVKVHSTAYYINKAHKQKMVEEQLTKTFAETRDTNG